MISIIRTLLWLAVIVGIGFLFGKFLQQNQEIVHFQLFDWESAPYEKGTASAFIFLAGVLLTSAIFFSIALSRTLEASRLRRENSGLQKLLGEIKEFSARQKDGQKDGQKPQEKLDHSSSSK